MSAQLVECSQCGVSLGYAVTIVPMRCMKCNEHVKCELCQKPKEPNAIYTCDICSRRICNTCSTYGRIIHEHKLLMCDTCLGVSAPETAFEAVIEQFKRDVQDEYEMILNRWRNLSLNREATCKQSNSD